MWFFLKLVVFLFIYVWLRATLPRFRYDQLMDLGWKKLIPASLFWLLLVAALRIGRLEGWNLAFVLGGGVAVGGARLVGPGRRPRAWARWTTPSCPPPPWRVVRQEVAR